MTRSSFSAWLKRHALRRTAKRRSPLSLEALEERTLLASGLVAAYNFNEGSGTVLHDVSGNNNNGTVTNATWSSAGKFGGALSFNGTTSLVSVAGSASLNLTKGMTLEAWIDPTSLKSPDAGWSAAIVKEHFGSADNIAYALYAANGTGMPPAGHVLVNGADRAVVGQRPVPLKAWTFLAATYDGTTLRTYVNGALVGSATVGGAITTTPDPLRIGGDAAGEMFTGLIDNVRIYNTALTQSAIQADMNTAVPSQGNAPTVTGVSPANGATGVAVGGSVQVTFSEALDPTTVSASTVQLLGPSGAAVAATVSYNATTFTATLTPSAALGYSTAYTVLVHGGTMAPVVKDTAGNALAANFSSTFTTASQTAGPPVASAGPAKSGPEGTAVTFAGSVTAGQAPLTYSWSFGDGGTATGTLSPSHVYQEAGTYTATLTVTDSLGRASTSSATATVSEVTPTASAGGPYSGAVNAAISFSGTATDAPADLAGMAYSWSFGDGGTAATASASHAYAAAGTYTVTLTVTDPDGLKATASTTATVSAGTAQPFPNNGNPPPLSPPTGTVINVSTVSGLQSAVANLQSGQTILVAPGTYQLTGTLYFPQNLTNIAIRGASGKAGDVVIQGDAVLSPTAPYSGSAVWGAGSGISGTIPFGVWFGNVQGVTVADLTLKNFVDDAVMLNAGVQSPLIHDVVMLDAGEQLLKSNPDGAGGGVNNGVVEYCTIGYTVAAPNNYTNGIDVHTGQNWVVRNNVFQNITTTNPLTTVAGGALAGPAVLFWNGSKSPTVVANTFLYCQREVAFGLSDPSSITNDNSGGLIANNFIHRSGGQHGDVAIGVWNSPSSEVANNTVILNGDYPNAVEYRFATTTGVKVLYNLTDAAITARDGATATVTGNVTNAQAAWFVNAGAGDLHLTAAATGAIGKGQALSEVSTDYDGQVRPASGADDVGADQYQAAAQTAGPPVASAGTAKSGPEGSAVTFSGSVTGGQPALSYSWSFGDGGTASGTLSPSHVYQEAGAYTATLTVTDALGRTSTSSATATVSEVTPTASAGGPYSGAPGAAISFSGTAADAPADLAGMKYAWSFGDGGTAATASASHAYAAAGTYTVTLTVTDPDGLTASSSTTATVTANGGGGTPNEPLLYKANVQYVGAFRVPAVADTFSPGSNTYDYGGTALAFNPADGGLFLVGMPYDQAISEVSVPSSIVNSSNLGALATAKVLQQPVQVLNKLPSDPLRGGTGGENIGGLAVVNGQLVGTDYIGYDATGSASVSHFVLSSTNLSAASVQGLYQVGSQGAGLVAGYMTAVPAEWQAALGAPYLTGQADLNIISRTSSGPAAFGFDPGKLGSGVTPATPYVYYPVNTPLGAYEGPADPLQSGTTQVKGAVFVPGSNSVLFFGSTGTNYNGYGEASTYGDSVLTAKGPHSLNGEYALQVWAYNAKDLLAVKQGTMQPWQVQPYDVWNFTLPTASTQVGGVAFDAATGRLYVSLLNADSATPYSSLPLIEVFQVTLPPAGGAAPAAPQVGTLAATPSTLAPGVVPAGTSVTLTAGNVYDINNNGSSVTQVAFYLDANKDGVLQTGTDTLLGYGAPSTDPNAGHNWTVTVSTTGLSSGSYKVFARATESDGLVSDPVATTLQIQ
jgi:PKD repeat protein